MRIDYGNVRSDRKYSVCLNSFAIACRTTLFMLLEFFPGVTALLYYMLCLNYCCVLNTHPVLM